MSKLKSILKYGIAAGAGFAAGRMTGKDNAKFPQWLQDAIDADEGKSDTRLLGEAMGYQNFVDRLKRVSPTKTYSEFWEDWETRSLKDRKKIILKALSNNADSGTVETLKIVGKKKFKELLDEQNGIEDIVEPDLEIYEDLMSFKEFENSPETQGFYEIHRTLVGYIEKLIP